MRRHKKYWEVTIPLEPASKSNQRQFFGPGRSSKSKKALTFTDAGMAYCRCVDSPRPPFEKDDEIALEVQVQYETWRPDLDCELVPDVLEKAGIIPNDRQIRKKHYYAIDPPGNPPYVTVRVWSDRKLRKAPKHKRGLPRILGAV